MTDVMIFAPSPVLTVTVEDSPGGPDIHIHAGGQGVWQARMLERLGVDVTLCCTLTGEVGAVLKHRLDDEGIELAAITREGRGAAYVHDRRDGEREEIADTEGDPLDRHDLDELYTLALREGLAAGIAVLSGPSGDDALPADTYRRLAADLRTGGTRVIVDLAGDRLTAAVEGGVDLLKVSHEELLADGLAKDDSVEAMLAAMDDLRERGAEAVIVSRASDSLLLLDDEGALELVPPQLEVTDTRGGGDSLTAGVVAGIAQGQALRDAILLGAAAGALNVTRHGLGTGDPGAIERLRERVSVRELEFEGSSR
jgi:1-phosphofructokinase